MLRRRKSKPVVMTEAELAERVAERLAERNAPPKKRPKVTASYRSVEALIRPR